MHQNACAAAVVPPTRPCTALASSTSSEIYSLEDTKISLAERIGVCNSTPMAALAAAPGDAEPRR